MGPEREKLLLEKLDQLNPGPMSSETLRAIYREIMSGSMKIELPLRIAYLGPEATYTHLAAKNVFGHGMPMENSWTVTPKIRAAMKCPHS